MMSEWVENILGNYCEIKHGFAFKGEFFTDRMTRYYLVTPANFAIGGGFQKGKDIYYAGEFPNEYLLKKGDLIVTMTDLSKTGDTLGFSALVPDNENYEFLHNQRIGKVFVDEKEANKYFIYWLMRTSAYQRYVVGLATGSTVKHTAPKSIKSFKYKFPPLQTQSRIAEILSAYDDAIENNNRRIVLLEKATRELYREWFVRMRFPGHENVTFANGLPEGWEVKRLGEFCYVTDGTHDTPKQTESGVPLVTGKHIKNGFIDFNGTYTISEADHAAISRRSGLDSGDILLSNIGTVGSICIVDYFTEFSVKNVIILKPRSEVKTAYLYLLMTSSVIQDILSAQTNGASQQFVGLTFMRRFKILVPGEIVLEKFAKLISTFLTERRTLHIQSQNLARQRDLLLPRLMSGKLEV